ncbi:phosphotransferase family protein [Gephyromycinifex aptenodytis]|uniref:phosphotransferase family protein n=1 Tax=Gephyromycinifex aptenodytis TaxID=2716227 RepID=UPI001445C050|nr:phosphotransferase family protein [Gephyromycinifex aptenodytis]
MNSASELRGLDLAALRAHLDQNAPHLLLQGPLTARLIAGGKSNLTFEVGDGQESLVLRRPPLGHVLATAHDMGREYRVMEALAATDVPVPRMYLLCEEPSVLGAPFYLMSKADGTPYRTASQLAPLGPQRTRAIGLELVEILARLHRVDPAAIGLADLGRPDGFYARQVSRWTRQLQASHSRDLAGARELSVLLAQIEPTPQPAAIVHGDYRLDNLLVDDQDTVTAVLDWEMATLGDPLTDVGLLVVYSKLAEMVPAGSELVPDVSQAPGFPPIEELLSTYAEHSGRDLSDLRAYVGLAFYKLAVILEGIHYRYIQGQTLGDGFSDIGDYVEPLLAGGLIALRA